MAEGRERGEVQTRMKWETSGRSIVLDIVSHGVRKFCLYPKNRENWVRGTFRFMFRKDL